MFCEENYWLGAVGGGGEGSWVAILSKEATAPPLEMFLLPRFLLFMESPQLISAIYIKILDINKNCILLIK